MAMRFPNWFGARRPQHRSAAAARVVQDLLGNAAQHAPCKVEVTVAQSVAADLVPHLLALAGALLPPALIQSSSVIRALRFGKTVRPLDRHNSSS